MKPDRPKPPQEPQIQVRMRLEGIEDDDRAADLFGTILRSVRAALARRGKEREHNGQGTLGQPQRAA